jgi:hypothetical protein
MILLDKQERTGENSNQKAELIGGYGGALCNHSTLKAEA